MQDRVGRSVAEGKKYEECRVVNTHAELPATQALGGSVTSIEDQRSHLHRKRYIQCPTPLSTVRGPRPYVLEYPIRFSTFPFPARLLQGLIPSAAIPPSRARSSPSRTTRSTFPCRGSLPGSIKTISSYAIRRVGLSSADRYPGRKRCRFQYPASNSKPDFTPPPPIVR